MAVEIGDMVDVVQLVRASDCGSECRGFESHPPPSEKQAEILYAKGFRFSFLCFVNSTLSLEVEFKWLQVEWKY